MDESSTVGRVPVRILCRGRRSGVTCRFTGQAQPHRSGSTNRALCHGASRSTEPRSSDVPVRNARRRCGGRPRPRLRPVRAPARPPRAGGRLPRRQHRRRRRDRRPRLGHGRCRPRARPLRRALDHPAPLRGACPARGGLLLRGPCARPDRRPALRTVVALRGSDGWPSCSASSSATTRAWSAPVAPRRCSSTGHSRTRAGWSLTSRPCSVRGSRTSAFAVPTWSTTPRWCASATARTPPRSRCTATTHERIGSTA